MRDQVKRLLVIFVIIVVGFLTVRKLIIPESFGEFGHYRGDAIDSVTSQGLQYAGHRACYDCHDDIGEIKKISNHRTVNCEACHGPAVAHIASFEEDEQVFPVVPRKREHCMKCHAYNPAKPTGFPQIDPVLHNPIETCISCHNPHHPEPSEVPGSCSACHTKISRTKGLSPHAQLECIECHSTPEEHKSNPRAWKPEKPTVREQCGKCHGKNAESDRLIPRIDLKNHGEGYLCWQCHYPHYPEAK